MSKEILHQQLFSLLNEAEGRFMLPSDKKKWIKSAQKLKGQFISEGKNYIGTAQEKDFLFNQVWDARMEELSEKGSFKPETFKALDEIRQGL